MADTKISDLTAVTTPASTDEFAVNQGGTSKKQTRAQVHALETGEKLVLPTDNTPLVPSLAWGDGDTGFYESTDDIIRMAIGGTATWAFSGALLGANTTPGPGFLNETPTATNPTVAPDRADTDTGIGTPGANQLSLVAGALDCIQVSNVSSARRVGFYVTAPVALQTGVNVDSAGIHAALVNLGLITA